MRRGELTVALGTADQAHLILVLLTSLHEAFRCQQRDLDSLLRQAVGDCAALLRLVESSHELGEQTDHLLLAIAKNDAAQHLERRAEELFDGFRDIEAAAQAALNQQKRS